MELARTKADALATTCYQNEKGVWEFDLTEISWIVGSMVKGRCELNASILRPRWIACHGY